MRPELPESPLLAACGVGSEDGKRRKSLIYRIIEVVVPEPLFMCFSTTVASLMPGVSNASKE